VHDARPGCHLEEVAAEARKPALLAGGSRGRSRTGARRSARRGRNTVEMHLRCELNMNDKSGVRAIAVGVEECAPHTSRGSSELHATAAKYSEVRIDDRPTAAANRIHRMTIAK
jgi:hypothetical protein